MFSPKKTRTILFVPLPISLLFHFCLSWFSSVCCFLCFLLFFVPWLPSADIVEGQRRGGGGPKMTKIHYGVKPDIFKNAPLPPWRLPGDHPETKGWEGVKGGGVGAAGACTTTPCNGWVMALNRGHNSTRRPPEREKKRTKFRAGEREKKRAKFPAEGGLEEGAAAEGGPGDPVGRLKPTPLWFKPCLASIFPMRGSSVGMNWIRD